MSRSVCIPMIATLLLSACQPIVVRVGPRRQGMEAEPLSPSSPVDYNSIKSWNSITDFLQHLDDIKAMGRDALLKRYHQDGRQQIRETFRTFRDAVAVEAGQEGWTPLPYLEDIEIGTCVPIQTRDIFALEPYGDLRALLETVFLGRIKPESSVPDPAVPGGIDTITRLGFFELGIAMEGDSFVQQTADEDIQGSDLRWKVIHENDEPEDWIEQDQKFVAFRFLKRHEAEKRTQFRLLARLLDEEQDLMQSLPTVQLDYYKSQGTEGLSRQIMILQTGERDGEGLWQTLRLSRRIIVSQDIQQGHILHVSATEHWQKQESFQKNFRLDMDARRLCSVLGGP